MRGSTKETLKVFALVIAVGLMCGFFGFMGGVERGKNEERWTSLFRQKTATVIVDVDTLLLDRWQIELMPVEVIMPQIKIRYKIKLGEENTTDTALAEYQLQHNEWHQYKWNPETKKWEKIEK